jgi:hypothetical protein
MKHDVECISERIHDADHKINENMVHWLHQFLSGDLDREGLANIFEKAYDKQEHIYAPWEM